MWLTDYRFFLQLPVVNSKLLRFWWYILWKDLFCERSLDSIAWNVYHISFLKNTKLFLLLNLRYIFTISLSYVGISKWLFYSFVCRVYGNQRYLLILGAFHSLWRKLLKINNSFFIHHLAKVDIEHFFWVFLRKLMFWALDFRLRIIWLKNVVPFATISPFGPIRFSGHPVELLLFFFLDYPMRIA